MKISSRFSVAVHIMLAICVFEPEYKITSEFLSSSVNVNPVIIRRTLLKLKAAGLVEIKQGSGGARLKKPAETISLFEIYSAVDCVEGSLFHFHENPNPDCPVGRKIHAVLDGTLLSAQNAMEAELRRVTLRDLQNRLNRCNEKNS